MIKNLCEEFSLPVGASCIELFEITQNFGSLVLKLACVVCTEMITNEMSVAGRKVQLILCMLTHCGRVTQICVFTFQPCRTGDANLRF